MGRFPALSRLGRSPALFPWLKTLREDRIGDVDAVVAWVDGGDPVHAAKRKRFMKAAPDLRAPTRNATKGRRFSDNDEIRFCLRSLRNHAPWLRTVWLVTDDQFPASIDRAEAERSGIRVIDHRHIFRGFEDLLPTFNSQAIESMLWRIDGLADRFLYLNDDMFLIHPTRKRDFFSAKGVRLRGTWKDLSAQPVSLHGQRRLRSGEMLGYSARRHFAPNHVVYPMLRAAMAELFERFGPEFMKNASYRFRDADQFWAVSLHNHYALSKGLAVKASHRDMLHFSIEFCAHAGADELRARLDQLNDPAILAVCMNYLEAVARKVPEVFRRLDAVTGPPAPFERPGS